VVDGFRTRLGQNAPHVRDWEKTTDQVPVWTELAEKDKVRRRQLGD
jgi:hypothetical protein